MNIHFFSFLIFALLFGRTIEYYVEKYIQSPLFQSVIIILLITIFFTVSGFIYKRYNLSSIKVRPKVWIPTLIIAIILSVTLYELNILPS